MEDAIAWTAKWSVEGSGKRLGGTENCAILNCTAAGRLAGLHRIQPGLGAGCSLQGSRARLHPYPEVMHQLPQWALGICVCYLAGAETRMPHGPNWGCAGQGRDPGCSLTAASQLYPLPRQAHLQPTHPLPRNAPASAELGWSRSVVPWALASAVGLTLLLASAQRWQRRCQGAGWHPCASTAAFGQPKVGPWIAP